MTRARNLAGLGTVTAQPTVTTPVHLGPLGVGTFARIYGTWEHDQINSVSIGTTQLQISGITTGLNVSGIITAQNGLNITGNIVNGLNVTAGIATLQALTATTGTFTGDTTFSGAVSIAGTLTYEDVTAVDVVGVATFRSDLNIADKIVHTGDTNTAIRFPAADTFTVETGGTERLRIDSGGRMGIGITPDAGEGAELSIKSSDGQTNVGLIPNTNSESSQLTFYNAANDSAQGYIRYNNSDNSLQFRVNLAERLRITSAGRVGINETSPDTDLHIKNTNPAIYLEGTNGSGRQHKIWTAGSNSESLQFTSGSLYYNADTHYFRATNESTEYLRIDSSGRVLIASDTSRTVWGANPQTQIEKLDSNAAFSIIRNSNTAAGPWIALCKSRGTANGAVTIVQDGDSLGSIDWFGADGGDLANVSAEIKVEIDGTPGSNDLPGRMIFRTTADGAGSPTERMRIASDGEVFIGDGFGTADRSTLLSISGTNQDPTGVWSQVGLYSNDSQAANKGGSIGFGGQDGSTTKQQFAAIKGAKENGTSGNYAGYMAFYTRPAGAVSGERLRITSAGHMGLGVTPSPWATNADSLALQIGTGFSAFGRSTGDDDRGGIGVNNYNDGSANKYIANGHANRIYMNDGNIDFQYGPNNSSGAGQTVTLSTTLRIDTSGSLLVGTTSDSAPDGFASLLQVNSANHTGSIVVGRHTANSNGPAFLFQKSRSGSATPGVAVLSSGDSLGVIRWYGADGSDRNSSAAQIQCVVDGAPGGNDMPGKLIFNTTSDGASSSTERMYINNTGQVLFAGTPGEGHGIAASYGLYVLGLATSGSATDTGISVNQGNAGATSLIWSCRNTNDGTATQSSLYFMKWYYSGDNAPVATKIEGDSITFGVSGSNTLTITGGAGNFRAAMIWLT